MMPMRCTTMKNCSPSKNMHFNIFVSDNNYPAVPESAYNKGQIGFIQFQLHWLEVTQHVSPVSQKYERMEEGVLRETVDDDDRVQIAVFWITVDTDTR